jgi:hypothetical protein
LITGAALLLFPHELPAAATDNLFYSFADSGDGVYPFAGLMAGPNGVY